MTMDGATCVVRGPLLCAVCDISGKINSDWTEILGVCTSVCETCKTAINPLSPNLAIMAHYGRMRCMRVWRAAAQLPFKLYRGST